jgi:glycosyltransferase involved in cell wall biosynthesis
MADLGNGFSAKDSGERTVRPVLIASSHTLSEYSLYLHRLLIGLADESIPVALVCPDKSEVQSVVSPTTEIVRHPAIRLPFMGRENRKILVEKIDKFKPTVIHCLCESCAALARQVSKDLDLPYLLSINDLPKESRQLSVSMKRLAGIIAPAESIADNLRKNYPNLADRIKQIKMGTFVSESACCFSRPERLTAVAVACPAKGKTDFGKFLSAIKRLAVEGREFMTIIIGDGTNEKPLRSIISALGISANVSIIPRTEPWREVLLVCDIFVEPYRNNFFNPILLEALSVGTAVAGCKGGVDDLIIEDRTAAILTKSDEQDIYYSLGRLLDNRQSAMNLAAKAQDFVRKNHTVSKMAAETIKIYRQAQSWYNHT